MIIESLGFCHSRANGPKFIVRINSVQIEKKITPVLQKELCKIRGVNNESGKEISLQPAKDNSNALGMQNTKSLLKLEKPGPFQWVIDPQCTLCCCYLSMPSIVVNSSISSYKDSDLLHVCATWIISSFWKDIDCTREHQSQFEAELVLPTAKLGTDHGEEGKQWRRKQKRKRNNVMSSSHKVALFVISTSSVSMIPLWVGY